MLPSRCTRVSTTPSGHIGQRKCSRLASARQSPPDLPTWISRRRRASGSRRLPPRVHTVPGWASQCYAFIRHLSAQCQPSGWHSVPSATPVPQPVAALSAQCQPGGWHSMPSATPVPAWRLAPQCRAPAWRLALSAQRHASAAARNLLRRSVPT